ncbi:hypothetical protein TRIUR3_10983 [Triticum urartu]|uniref:Protein LHCP TRANSLOCATION DEFECT n=2 Tax=Triticum TaxID=4564 RepID=A0A9R1NR40_TRITD|nr:hypothetical protein TRIUR3_10983 [Triticum urartu]VAH29488.1 unnamed protein product [Triticum turgidum subsp. durum]
MASIPCTIQLATKAASSSSGWRSPRAVGGVLRTPQLGGGAAWLRPSLLSKVAPARESGRVRFFKFGNKDAEGAGIYGSQARDDFDRDDVEQSIHPVDILLILAASEGDLPKIEELLKAGAKYDVKDADGRTALDRASGEVREFITGFAVAKKA